MASLDNTTNSLPVAGSTEDEVQVYSPLGTIAVSFATVLLGAIGDKVNPCFISSINLNHRHFLLRHSCL